MAERDPRIIGPRIARARQAAGLTQIELAKALGVSPSSVADWERGVAYPKRKLGKIEQYFGHALDYDEGFRPSATAEEAIERALEQINAAVDELRRSRGKGNQDEEPNGSRHSA